MTDSRMDALKKQLRDSGDDSIAQQSRSFFKTGKGQYGEGDRFLGIRVPDLRKLAKAYRDVSINETGRLLRSEFHEERLLALFMLVDMYQKASRDDQKKIYDFYLQNTAGINSWDLVDSSAPQIVGAYLHHRSKKPLYKLVRSGNLWERRIAVLATFHFIKAHAFDDALRLCEILKNDREDLIHKAAGWMLREIGKRNMEAEERFLLRHYHAMPRTMLRYAIEKFPEARRQAYLKGTAQWK